MARHKVAFELAQHRSIWTALEQRARGLETQTVSILESWRRVGPELNLASDAAIELEDQLAGATNELASFRNEISRLKELRRTVEVNRRNYLLHSLRLISKTELRKAERSCDREQAAMNAFNRLNEQDGIFGTDVGTMTQQHQQLDTDIGYSESTAEQHASALRSVTDQLRIYSEREIAEMGSHMAVDSAAVVASLAALVVMELAAKPHREYVQKAQEERRKAEETVKQGQLTGKEPQLAVKETQVNVQQTQRTVQQRQEPEPRQIYHDLEVWALVGSIVLIVYGLTQALGARFRGDKPGRRSLVAGATLGLVWAGGVWVNHNHSFSLESLPNGPFPLAQWLLVIVLAGGLGLLAGLAWYQFTWRHARKSHKKGSRVTPVNP